MMSAQQQAYLKAMGIDVWVERDPVALVEDSSRIEPEQPVSVEPAATETVAQVIPEAGPVRNIEALNWPEFQSAVAECQLCDLAANRTKVVVGAGNQSASLMILGDAPTRQDEQQGMPFSGEAGNLLTAMIKAMGYQRNEVYISNLVKCRTAENQEPATDEVEACKAYITRQIQLVQPKVILVLGSVTAQRFLKSKSTMARLRGQLHYIDELAVPVIVTYEPGYLLRSPSEKRKAWEDLQLAMKELSTVNISLK
ncbi:MAG: uracil-DNA glycosylase [Gammaproteobacteria bacterium]|nr:uracil-DNA glycosylase [Gammaproteobacteria bacterium]